MFIATAEKPGGRRTVKGTVRSVFVAVEIAHAMHGDGCIGVGALPAAMGLCVG